MFLVENFKFFLNKKNKGLKVSLQGGQQILGFSEGGLQRAIRNLLKKAPNIKRPQKCKF